MLDLSTLNNKSFYVLKSFNTRLEYVLKMKGILVEEEKYALAPDFLMEMMELNEQLTESDKEQISKFEIRISKLQKDIYAPIKQIVENYKEGVTTEKELLQVKDYKKKKKYLARIFEGMER